MGRYTTVQTYSDTHDGIAKVTYEQATGGKKPAGLPTVPGEAAGGGGGGLATEKVNNVSGTQAGAGSGGFHTYRAQRRREVERVEKIEAGAVCDDLDAEFEAHRSARQSEVEERAKARSLKRQRKRERAQARKEEGGRRGDADGAGAGAAAARAGGAAGGAAGPAQEGAESGAKRSKVLETPSGQKAVANDGTFLAMMLAAQAEKKDQA